MVSYPELLNFRFCIIWDVIGLTRKFLYRRYAALGLSSGDLDPTLCRVRIRRGPSRALASISILTTAAALAIGTLPSAASASSAAAGRTASHAQSAHSLASARSGPSVPAALAAAAARAAASARPGSGAAASPVTGAITGTVRGLGSAPLPGACVTATGSGRSVTTRARADGRFAIAGLAPGAYTVSYRDCARPAAYFEQRYGSASLASGSSRAGAAPVMVSPGRPLQLAPVTLRATDPAAEVAAMRPDVQARLAQMSPAASSGGVISGTVRNRAGQPVPHFCVQAYSSHDWWIVRTGKHGGYRLPVGTSGKWRVQFDGGCGNAGNYAPQWWRHAATGPKATKLTMRRGRSFHGIDAVLRRGGTITGKVTSATTGTGLKRVCVDAAGLHGMSGVEMEVLTRPDGSYSMKDLGTGRYQISFEADCAAGDYLGTSRKAPVSVTDGKTTGGINVALRPGAEIHGTVTSAVAGTPVADVCVEDQNGDEDITGPGGGYALTGLTPGSYTLSFTPGCYGNRTSDSYAPQYYDNVVNQGDATPVHLTTGQIKTGINAALQPGGTVTGQVTTRSGAPIEGACVGVISRNLAGGLGQNVYLTALAPLFAEVGSGVSGPKGHFTIRNLTAGQYSVVFAGGCGHGSAKYAFGTFEPQGGGRWISVGAGTTTAGVTEAMQVGGTISGTVTGRGGAPLPQVCVGALPQGNQLGYLISLGGPESRRDGSYSVSGLAPGRYAVVFTPCGRDQSYAEQWYREKPSRASATAVTVSAGRATRHINAALRAGGTITGQVRSGATGKPLKNVCVILADSKNQLTNLAGTNSAGQYRLSHVAAGQWKLELSQCQAENPSAAGIVRGGYRVRNGKITRASFTLPQAGSISGTVQGGSPAAAEPGICVEATPLTGHGQPWLGLTGQDGSYTVPGLAAGTYRVLFTPLCLFGTADVTPQWYNGASSAAAAAPVTVTGGQTTTGIGATLAADGAISGTVTVSGTATAGVCVGAYAGSSAKPAAIAITGKDGSYQMSGLTAGGYSVEFSNGCGASGYTAQWYGGATRAAATPVTVTAGATATGIDAS